MAKGKPGLFLAASVLSISAAIFTSVVMIPTNFELIRRNEKLGGSHSAQSAEYRQSVGAEPRSAEESVNGKDDISQWSDLSDPQEKTRIDSTKEQDEEARGLLTKFQRLNCVRAALLGAGGIVGLIATLT